jgi:hypothetical protein
MHASTQSVVRDILAELDDIQNSAVLRAACREVIRQVGKERVKEMAVRAASAYITTMNLPLDGALAKRAALPAVERMVGDAIEALET